MAKKETVIARIQKAEENIAKKQNTVTKKTATIAKKAAKVEKAGFEVDALRNHCGNVHSEEERDAIWTVYDIETLEDDIKRLRKEIDELEGKLDGYRADLKKIEEKEASRNVQVILRFLEMWKGMVKDYYENCVPKWIEARDAYYEADRVCCQESNYGDWRRTGDKTKLNALEEARKLEKARFKQWDFLTPYIIGYKNISLDWDKIQSDLDYEAERKYDFIIERTNEVVGQITDASNLDIGCTGELNGYIIGTSGKAKVQTIGAGGYNIQCFHFRTLVNPMK